MNFGFNIDLRVLVFTAASALLTLLIFGRAPLAYAPRVSLLEPTSGSRTSGRTQLAEDGFDAEQFGVVVAHGVEQQQSRLVAIAPQGAAVHGEGYLGEGGNLGGDVLDVLSVGPIQR